MNEFLVFRLYGPLAAWGDVAVGEQRPTFLRPSKSAVLGLVSAALGIERGREEALDQVARGYGVGFCVDQPGELMVDYHTAQWPAGWTRKPWRKVREWNAKRRISTRRGELGERRDERATTQSWRGYVCDASAWACIWCLEDPPHALEELASALRRPVFVPYLGRKACVLGLPMTPQVVSAPDPVAAFGLCEAGDDETRFLGTLGMCVEPPTRAYYWEGDFAGLRALATDVRRDQPLSRGRWQFVERREHMLVWHREEAAGVSQ